VKILIACEFSGRVRDAFIAQGHEAISCDLLPSDAPGPHIQGCALEALATGAYDACIAFPPCTHLCSSGARWWSEKAAEQAEAIEFVKALWQCGPAKMAIENPVGKLSTAWQKPSQIIQPWQHGHGETKTTCLWTRGLPFPHPSNVVEGRRPHCWLSPDSKDRWKRRSVTFEGIAAAMATQWGGENECNRCAGPRNLEGSVYCKSCLNWEEA